MRVLVTGARGKVGRFAVAELARRDHDVIATDLMAPEYEADLPGQVPYLQADLTDAGAAYAIIRTMDAVVHAAAIPDPVHHAPHVVFANNLMATFNVIEACIRWRTPRLVNISSETVPGFIFPETPARPVYVPVDEEHPVAPQDPYALAKYFGEQLADAAVRRSDLTVISIRPSWVAWEGNYERNLGPFVREASLPSPTFWSYIDAEDLGEMIALATESELPGHEVFYAANPDNVGGHDLAAEVRARYGDTVVLRPLNRVDASGISCAKAERMLGWRARRSWRDHLG
ncbi:MAG: NAD-dependent epimerase/dehydratase family protein [Actinomycetes bacterium]